MTEHPNGRRGTIFKLILTEKKKKAQKKVSFFFTDMVLVYKSPPGTAWGVRLAEARKSKQSTGCSPLLARPTTYTLIFFSFFFFYFSEAPLPVFVSFTPSLALRENK